MDEVSWTVVTENVRGTRRTKGCATMSLHALPDRREEPCCGKLPRWPHEGTAPCRRSEPRPQISVQRELQQRLRQVVDVARLQEESFPLMLRQAWEVPGPPADDGEAERHRLAPDGPVWLAGSRKDEDVGRLVEARDVLAGYGPMRDDAAAEVGLR